tara:strand:+ start:539 stop:769 length:231 start_codon:yes stop_codon:yes gene_type:complete
MIPGAPIYEKVELLVKDGNNVINVTHDNSGMVITGNHILIISETDEGSKGKVYKMEEIEGYQLSNPIPVTPEVIQG